jgi:hypothetical protein
MAAKGADNPWTNPDWIDYTREATCHELCADPSGNLQKALISALKAAEHGMVRARQWATLLTEAGRDANNVELQKLGHRLAEGIRGEDLTHYLSTLLKDASLDDSNLVIAYKRRGISFRLMRRY